MVVLSAGTKPGTTALSPCSTAWGLRRWREPRPGASRKPRPRAVVPCVWEGAPELVMRVCARALCSAGTGPGRKCTRPRKVAGVPDLGLSVAVSSYISVPVQMSLLCNSEMSRGGSRHVNPKGGRGREAQVRALPTARRSRRGPSVPPHAAEAFRPVPRARCPRGRGVCTPGVCPSPRFRNLIQEPGPSFPNGTKSTLRAQVDLFLSPKSIRVYVAMVTRKLFGGVGRKWDWLHLWPVGLHCGKGGAIM